MNELLGEARQLSKLLMASAEISRGIFAAIANELGLPVPIARALCELDEPQPMTGLAERLACDKSYITPLADQMESLGYVNRVPGADRRIKVLELTATGQKVRDELERQIAQRSPAMASLTSSERSQLSALLQKVSGAGNCPRH